MIPHRPLGARYNSPNLPTTTPIIGLGCSSFSTFFFPEQEETSSIQEEDSMKLSLRRIATQVDADQLLSSLNCYTSGSSSGSNSTPPVVSSINKTYPSIIKSWVETIHYAIENGITLLDTAPWYGHGTSEVIIGLALEKYFNNNKNTVASTKDAVQREDLIINTKIGRYDSNPTKQFDFTYKITIQSIQRSIQRMKCSYIDVIQIHDPEFVSNIDILIKETIPALIECRNELKIVKGIGLTGYPLEVQYYILNKVEKELKVNGIKGLGVGEMMIFDQCLTYCHFNLHSQSLFTKSIGSMDEINSNMRRKGKTNDKNEENDWNEIKMTFAEYCHSKSISLMAAAPLSMGLLTYSTPPSWHPASTTIQNACRNASLIAKSHNVDLPTLAILFSLVHNGISCTLLGIASKTEVDVALNVMRRVGNVHLTSSHTYDGDKNENRKGLTLRRGIQSVLESILTPDEKHVLSLLMDEANGPFAEIWASDEYEWDGIHEAEKFWLLMKENMKETD